MRVTLIDCYDSFTYNIVQALGLLGLDVTVLRCDEVEPERLLDDAPSGLVIGPGPGRPEDAGNILEAIHWSKTRLPMLGICMGHQAIGLSFGAQLTKTHPVHGHASNVVHSGKGLFTGLVNPVRMTRYHSLVIQPDSVPSELMITATAKDETIMAFRHRVLPIFGVQFHPESVLSGHAGLRIMENFKNEMRECGQNTGVRGGPFGREFEQRP